MGRLLIAFSIALAAPGGGRLSWLRVLGDDYPRAFFFRDSEGLAANPGVPRRTTARQWAQSSRWGRATVCSFAATSD
jgi:hypothetical protein